MPKTELPAEMRINKEGMIVEAVSGTSLTLEQYQEILRRCKAEPKMRKALNLILNENFSGQSTISPYAKRQIEQALED